MKCDCGSEFEPEIEYTHYLICGDCTDGETVERLVNENDIIFGFADPPYNLGIKYIGNYDDKKNISEYKDFCLNFFKICSILVNGVIAITPGIGNLNIWYSIKEPEWVISWIKKNGVSRNNFGGPNKWEPILIWNLIFDRDKDCIEVNNVYNNELMSGGFHPVSKPVKLMENLIRRFSLLNDSIIDFFIGSGTTIIAAERLGRRCFAVEISPHYCAVALERYYQMTGIEPVLIED